MSFLKQLLNKKQIPRPGDSEQIYVYTPYEAWIFERIRYLRKALAKMDQLQNAPSRKDLLTQLKDLFEIEMRMVEIEIRSVETSVGRFKKDEISTNAAELYFRRGE